MLLLNARGADLVSNDIQPNFLHAGDHVHLGPGVSSMRRTNPALGLHELPRIDLVLLSHYHGCVHSDN